MPGFMMAQTVVIDSVATVPGNVLVQVDMLDFTGTDGDVAAITLTIEYDSDLLDFVSLENINATFSGSWLAQYNAGTDQLIITYFDLTGHDINGKLLDIKFDYVGGFSSDVMFDEDDCEIVNSSLETITASYEDGFVEQTGGEGTVSMYDISDTVGNTIEMPVTMVGTGGFVAVDAITLVIGYDDDQLAFTGLVEDAITGVIANAQNGVLTITWTGTATNFTTLDTLFKMLFNYYGGDADLAFLPGCEISTSTTPIATDYVDGSVSPLASTAALTIQSVGGDTSVSVPIVAADIIQTVGAITLNIAYDDTRLTYGSCTPNQLSGWVITGSVSGEITMEWSNSGGAIISDGNLITMNFYYDTTMGGIANIGFDPGCELANTNLNTIPIAYTDGVVGGFPVSGILKYATSNLPLASSTVYLKTADGLTKLDSTTTDASGNYEFLTVAPGSYKLGGATTIAWGGVTLIDYALIRAFVTLGSPVLSGIYWEAADVNGSGTVTLIDYALVRNQVTTGSFAGWRTERWYFDEVDITVSNSALTGQDILSICYGDVNASYIVP